MILANWRATTIGEHADVLTGFAFRSADYTSTESDVKLLRGDNIAPQKLRWRDVKRFPNARMAEVARYELRAGDFVIAMDRTWLPSGVKVAEVTSADLPCLLVQRVARLRSKPTLDQGLMRQLFSDHQFSEYVRGTQTATAVPHISPNDLKSYPILLPPLSEQRRIAEILSTWDRAIETVEALIANAREHKAALMQALLSGERRLPGFTALWSAQRLADVAEVIVSNIDKKSRPGERAVRLCNYTDVYASDRIESDQPFMAATASSAQIERFGLCIGDVLITKDSETPGDIAISSYVASTSPDLVCGYHLAILRPKTADGQFLKYLLEQPVSRQYFASHANGATRFGLTVGAIEETPLIIPELDEQHAIGEVVRGAELSLHRLTSQRASLRQEKAALMQQLLTGKRRVGAPDSEAA